MLYSAFFFFKQKTAYEMRISDWSSDVCSSDLLSVSSCRPYSLRTIVRSQAMQATIGKLAVAGGVGVETVRYCQRRGLMNTPARSGGDGWGGGVRRDGAADLRRLRFIRAAQGAGFTLDEIGDLLARSEEHTSELQSL